MQIQKSNRTIISPLSHIGLLSIQGPAAAQFLQGQLTCNIDDITENSSRLGAHCNPQGRIISLFRIFNYLEKYYLQMPKPMVPIALAALKKYAVFFKVELSDATGTLNQIGYAGSDLGSFFTKLPKQIDECIYESDLLIIKIPGIIPRYEIIGPQTKWVANESVQTWKELDIQANLPAIYPETSQLFLPHEVNLHKLNGISFNKGCYTGQEIIARMHYRGKLKKELIRLRLTSDAEPLRGGDLYLGEKALGNIVDFCSVGYNTYELLVIAPEGVTDLSLHPIRLER